MDLWQLVAYAYVGLAVLAFFTRAESRRYHRGRHRPN